MKNLLLFLTLLSPTLLFAQSYDTGGVTLIGIIMTLAITIGLFFLFRGIMLWYWKVDKIVQNQEETNRLLKSIARTLESKDDHKYE